MKFFDYREYMKNHGTAVFTGLDEECRRNAPGDHLAVRARQRHDHEKQKQGMHREGTSPDCVD